MVFKPINLARSSLVKTFTHGYAQSLFAASQSSSFSTTTSNNAFHNNVASCFGKVPPSHNNLQNVHSSGLASGAGAASIRPGHPDPSASESGLAAYYVAWHKHQKTEEKEWHQFQFAKRIGWKAPTTIPDQSRQHHTPQPREDGNHVSSSRTPLVRAHTASAVQDVQRSSKPVEIQGKVTIEQVEEVVQKEINEFQDEETSPTTHSRAATPRATPSYGFRSAASDTNEGSDLTSFSSHTPNSSVLLESEAEVYARQLADLAESREYAQVPPVFEAMLGAGVKPTASAYNALLLAAINLTKGKHQIVPKVLDVYTDLLRRQITPSTATYAILVELLAARSLDVAASRAVLLQNKRRHDLDGQGRFLLAPDQQEYDLLTNDDSLGLAIQIFDTSAASETSHIFPAETYRLLIAACANADRVGDMVRVYADMESQKITPPSGIFAPMIRAFAKIGDLRSSIECYEEYKALAVAHNAGSHTINRKDEEIYASVVEAYNICNRTTDALKFLGKLEDVLADAPQLSAVREAVATYGLLPFWAVAGKHHEALVYAQDKLESAARSGLLSKMCIMAADGNQEKAATEIFGTISSLCSSQDMAASLCSMLAMYLRRAELDRAQQIWSSMLSAAPIVPFVDSGAMFCIATIGTETGLNALMEARVLFERVRAAPASAETQHDTTERVTAAISAMASHILAFDPIPATAVTMTVLGMMTDNGFCIVDSTAALLSGLGPSEIAHCTSSQLDSLLQAQASVILGSPRLDSADMARFHHLMSMHVESNQTLGTRTASLIERLMLNGGGSESAAFWQDFRAQIFSQASKRQVVLPIPHQATSSNDYDPYSHSTDYKGSAAIAEELDKTQGRHALHLEEALIRLKNMRRAGRHPRYPVYAKLITAAAKENRQKLAEEIIALARHDVPYVAGNHIVHHGWTTILDAMVGACLTIGKRDLAGQFHEELLAIGATPSANTFGLYITTLKESTKTFDEATEAVKIFHRAQAEGVEPSSFLYNALIGKLGKARRIDDCLFHFAAMRAAGIRPTSVTYGTLVNALCRVSDDAFAEQLFAEMEAMPNYKPRPAPYNSLMQHFLSKQDKPKVLAYHARMLARRIPPTPHTYKLLLDAHTTLSPVDNAAADALLASIPPRDRDATHYASLIHARGCAQRDLAAARALFDAVAADRPVAPSPPLFQALLEAYAAHHAFSHDAIDPLRQAMRDANVPLTPYIANTLIHGWSVAGDVAAARAAYDELGTGAREPSTYEAMARAWLAAGERPRAEQVVREALGRGYPRAVEARVEEVLGRRA